MPTQYSVDPNTPAVVLTSRLEPDVYDSQLLNTTKASVHDGLWMLTQQWRMGEYVGSDGGSPIKTIIDIHSSKINRFQPEGGETVNYNHGIPLDTFTEALEYVPDLLQRIQMGKYWIKLITNSNIPVNDIQDYIGYYFNSTSAYNPPDLKIVEPSDYSSRSDEGLMNLLKLAEGRFIDGYELYKYLFNGGKAREFLPDPNTDLYTNVIDDLEIEYLSYSKSIVYVPEETCWQKEKLEYSFKVSAPKDRTSNADQNVIDCSNQQSGNQEWYDFDLSSDPNESLEESGDAISNEQINDDISVITENTIEYISSPISFKGMPRPRWWEFEDKNIDLANLVTQKSDLFKMMLIEFGILYSNDWFLLACTLPNGSINQIKHLVVTDSFGKHTKINPAGTNTGSSWQQWSMYSMNRKGLDVDPLDANLFLSSSSQGAINSQPIEKVSFFRDEMANMVWGMEHTIPSKMYLGRNGKIAELELKKYLVENSVYDLGTRNGILHTDASLAYKLSNSVPENWIPFIPVNVSSSDSRSIRLQRARFKRIIEGFVTEDDVTPRTNILSVGLNESTPIPLFINEEEILRPGVQLSTQFQRCRWYDGQIYTWYSMNKTVGKGEGRSGLSFDRIETKEDQNWDEIAGNLILNGRDFSENWISLASLTSISQNFVLAPDGTSYAPKMKRVSITPNGHGQLRQDAQFLQASTKYSYSFWAKRISLTDTISMDFSDNPIIDFQLSDSWKYFQGTITTGATFPSGKFIDIGSNSEAGGSLIDEEYSIWDFRVLEGEDLFK